MTIAQASALMPPPQPSGKRDPAQPARDMGTPSDIAALKRMTRLG